MNATSRLHSIFNITLFLLTLMTISISAHAKTYLNAKPEAVGMSSERLKRIDNLVADYVAQEKYAGVVTMLSRKGKIIHLATAGTLGIDNPAPMQADTLFRIYSMTKPITAIAMMMLYEQGKFHIDDPVAKYLPEFADQKLLRDGELVDPKSPMTIRQLLTHTAGLSYGWDPEHPVDIQYAQAKPFKSSSLSEFTASLAKLPLKYEPGSRYHYSVSFDVLGALIEKMSGMGLDTFFEQKIFKPLGMTDTSFELAEQDANRFASDQRWDYESNQIALVAEGASRSYKDVKLFVGGGGLLGTIGDYMRFCQMVLNGGELDGVRLLSPKTVAFLSANHLTPAVRAEGVGDYPDLDLYHGQSMALGYGVVTEPQFMPDLASKGELSWGGLAGTKFWIDPKEEIIGIAMVQLYQSPWPLRFDFKNAAYQAILELNE